MKSIPLSIISLLLTLNAHAESACDFTVFGVGLGAEESQAAEILQSQGFRRIETTSAFTNEALWPPEGIELNKEQMAYASVMADPKRVAALWEMAVTDAKLKEMLESIPPRPETPDKITIRLDIAGATSGSGRGRATLNRPAETLTGVRGVNVNYANAADRRLGRDEPGIAELSAEHDARNAARWAQYCSDAGAPDQQGARFESADQDRSCGKGSTNDVSSMRILVEGKSGHRCLYQYTSRVQGGEEQLRMRQ